MPKSFAEIVEEGNFSQVSDEFNPRQAAHWQPGLGDRVRGELVIIAMGSPLYTEEEVLRRMARTDDRLKPATAYELVVFAASQWNGRGAVMALGARYGRQAAPVIRLSVVRNRVLTVDFPEYGSWSNDRAILCVRVWKRAGGGGRGGSTGRTHPQKQPAIRQLNRSCGCYPRRWQR